MFELFMNICMDLWSWDAEISYELFTKTLRDCIANLKSHIGEEAHRYLESVGVIDNTGLTWEEQDRNTQKEIARYEELLKYLETDSNWTP